MTAQQVRLSKTPKKTFLYARIMFWVSIPLFILGAFFIALQLTNQLNSLNQIHRIQSEIAFKNTQKALNTLVRDSEWLASQSKLYETLDKLRESQGLAEISLFSLLENEPLFRENSAPWNSDDFNAMQEAVAPKQNNSNTHTLRVNKETRQLIAYFPLSGQGKNDIYIARAIFNLSDVRTAFSESKWTLGFIFGVIIFIGFIISQGIAQSILKPIKLLDKATDKIMRGELGKHVSIKTGDEIEALADRFNEMSDALQEMKRKAEDANPLTGLPGNSGIAYELQKRINERQKFVLFHCDLDRFKVFNDHFGLAQGDKAIKKSADFLKRAVREAGHADDFIGHQGGDDFIIITRPQKAREVGEYVRSGFKSGVVTYLYPKEDLERGHTMQLDRRRQTETGETVMVPFPLLSISMAGISNAKRDFADYSDCMARVAPVKKEAKKTVESNYLIVE